MSISEEDRYFNETDTGVYEATFLNEEAEAIPLSSIDSITLSLYYEGCDGVITYINNRNQQNVLNTNDCTYHTTSGLFTWNIQQEDTAVVSQSLKEGESEKHSALLEIVYNTSKRKSHLITLYVTNLSIIT